MGRTTEPKIIYFDIESTPAQFWGFRLGEQRVGWEQIKKEPVVCVICWAVNDGKVQSATFDVSKYKPDQYDDKSDYELIKKFTEIANGADLLIGHNGKNFDVAFLRSRIIKHHLPDLSPILIDDTYLLTKAIKTMSHALDYLLRKFGLGQKIQHRGLDMWKDVSTKKKKALREMVTYCTGDVEGLRKLYKYVKPYIKSNLNMAMFQGNPDACPSCGQTQRPLIIRKYNQKRQPVLQCPVCHKYPFTRGKSVLKNQKEYNR